ncbi:Gfo/Idh/MocA family oxidoreductase [Porifericola rhodea]|uniref:Gfo/Idh/MocA family protein n=1 Tax=Porifericola rhodea TaxID=930972 RepID=UPI002666EA5F|nr:Gfo/Idh/MocA family oxidoreductase [Porifericola rhodea]WKN29812.1 Gfo/Idh/MocA family oxidoreductase [Porifericola rhodea]
MKKDSPQKDTSRRNFVKGAAMSAAGFMIMPRHVLGGKNFVAPSDKVNVGIIGAGGKGKRNTSEFLKLDDVQVTAVADPAYYWNLADFYYRSEAGRGPTVEMIEEHYEGKTPNFKVAEYTDFREMLDKESALDAIVCSTPDHSHAYISLQAMRAGKHVYCEKPLTHNIWEAREVQKVAKETKLATQMGNSGHSADGIRETVEYLRAGVIGEVKEAHCWVPAGRWIPGLNGLPSGKSTLPINFDWDLWQGPRKPQAFHEHYVPVTWRDFWMYGCGALGDFGCHDMDAATWAFNLKAPESVQIFPAGFSNEDIAPYGEIGYYEFKKQGDQKPLKLTWYSGGLRPDLHEALPKDYKYPSRASMFVGEKGIIINDGGNRAPQVFPEKLRASIKVPKQTIPRSNGHFRDWVDAIKGGKPASSNFEYGARLTEITLLGVLSLRMGGEKIYWDAENMKAKGLPEADKFIKEPVREGWEMA